jgi:hypothetical protein
MAAGLSGLVPAMTIEKGAAVRLYRDCRDKPGNDRATTDVAVY